MHSPSAKSKTLRRLERHVEPWMLALSLVWLGLVVYELAASPTPFTNFVTAVIWAIFVAEFAVRFFIAPRKVHFLVKNWISIIALAVPALRIFRIFRFVRLLQLTRAARGLTLVRVFTGFNRGMRAVGRAFGKRGFGYAIVITLFVVLLGSAGMFYLEKAPGPGGSGFNSYWDALWWTAMMSTTSGTDYWPISAEGRVLAFLIALYAFSVFGYLAATLASAFVDQDRREAPETDLKELRAEIQALTQEVRALRNDQEMAKKISMQ